MYAVVKTGGKQYRVAEGDTIQVEKLQGEAGDAVKLDEVLLVVDGERVEVGRPHVPYASVSGKIVEHGRGRKLVVYKYKRRKHYRRKAGHRQGFTAVRITAITAPHAAVSPPAPPAAPPPSAESDGPADTAAV